MATRSNFAVRSMQTTVKFGGYVRIEERERQKRCLFRKAISPYWQFPYDLPIVGYGNNVVNTLMNLGCRGNQGPSSLIPFRQG